MRNEIVKYLNNLAYRKMYQESLEQNNIKGNALTALEQFKIYQDYESVKEIVEKVSSQ